MQDAFGRTPAFGLGVEEEVILVEPETLALRHAASEVIPRLASSAGSFKHETYEGLVELASPVCRNAVEAAATLEDMRRTLRDAGACFIGAGIHPDARWGDVVLVDEDRYREILYETQGLLRRTPTAAMHFHVGMPDRETAIVAHNRMRAHLPLLQALAANSPFWFGVDSGFATARAQLFRAFPRAVLPRAFADWEDFERVTGAAVLAGELRDYTFLWWDMRPHPNLGTVEVRAMDAQSHVGSACGLAALGHALLVRAAHEDDGPIQPSEALAESSFRASRDGLRATLWHEGAMTPVPVLARAAIDLARPYARDVGGEAALEEVERILVDGNGADRTRAAHGRGGMPAVLAHLEAEAYGYTMTWSP